MRTVITAACLILLATSSAQQEKRTTSAMSSGKAVLEAYVSAWNRHDFAALDKLLTPDAVHEDIAWPSRDEGPAQIKKFMQEMIALEPDFDWRLTNVIDSGSAVAAEWTWTATYTGDCPTVGHVVGMHSSGRGASVAVIENNGVVEQLFAAWSSHDPDRVVAFYTDDIAYEHVPLGRTSRGPC